MQTLDLKGLTRFRELILNEVKTSVLSAGSIIAYSGAEVPEGYLLCDGSEVSQTTYADLYAAIGTTYGEGSSDDDDDTFCLPDLTDRTLWGSDTVGEVLEAGLPEIYGKASVNCSGWSASSEGALSTTRTGSTCPSPITGVGDICYTFSAESYNSIYGNSDTVQPPALTTLFCIKY